MSSRLQLDVHNLSLGRRHLVNTYKVKAGIGVIAGKTVIHASAPSVWGTTKRALYKYTYLVDKHSALPSPIAWKYLISNFPPSAAELFW